MDKVRCTACRGAKQVMKLGAVMGDCGLCKGKGEINACNVPMVKIAPVAMTNSANVINQVANTVPVSIERELPLPESNEVQIVSMAINDVDVKVDGKRAIYKRKTIAK